ncbi:MAG: response regulator [Chloroflexi bacterium]|nr:response regulator [Chloroflexota bacterium]
MDETLPLVLCLDDDWRILEILSKILSRLPLEHVVTGSPLEAIELAQRLRPRLLILDLMLPEMSGWEALDKMRDGTQRDDLRVIVLTAKDAQYERLVAANVARVDLFLTKPFDAGELAHHILRLLDLPASEAWPASQGET